MYFLALLILFFELGGGGFIIPDRTFSFSTSLGTFRFGQILLLFSYLIMFLRLKVSRIRFTDPIFIVVFLFYFTIFLELCRGLIEQVPPRALFHGVSKIRMFFYFLPMIMFIKNEKYLIKFINYILYLGAFSAIVSTIQFLTGYSFNNVTIRSFSYGFYRVYHPGAMLMAFGILIAQANILMRYKTKKHSILIIFFTIGLLTTLHRNLIGGTILISIFMFLLYNYTNRKISFRIIYYYSFIGLIILSSGYIFLKYSGFGTYMFLDRMMSVIDDIIFFSGNFRGRYEIFNYSYSAVMNINPILGNGLSIVHNNLSPLWMTLDNTYANIFILFGYWGYFVFTCLILSVIRYCYKIYRELKLQYKAVSIAVLSFMILIIINSFFSANIIYSPHLSVIIVSLGLIYLIRYYTIK